MQSRLVRALFLPLPLSLALLLPPAAPAASVETEATGTLRVGAFPVPPFLVRDRDGHWEGLSIELWDAVARDLDWTYELRDFESVAAALQALRADEIDVVPVVAATLAYEVDLDLTHSYFESGVGIAVRAPSHRARWRALLRTLASPELLGIAVMLLLVWLFAGAVVWIFERRHNGAMFQETPVKGLGDGVWWAIVTMTTVGYGDKAPKTLGGRVSATVWMLVSIVLISGLTASITTQLTLEGLDGSISGLGDLPGQRVGTLPKSAAIGALAGRDIPSQTFDDERTGLAALLDERIDAFVFDMLVLQQLAENEFAGRLQVVPTFERYNVTMALAAGSPLREPLNRSILSATRGSRWQRLVERYVAPE